MGGIKASFHEDISTIKYNSNRGVHRTSISPPSCFTVSRRYGTEKKAIIKSAHAYLLMIKGILTSVILMLMFALMSYKK